MDDFEFDLQELTRQITALFETYKEELNGQEHPNVNYLLYNVNKATDVLLYKVKYEIDQFMKNKLQYNNSVETERVTVTNKKAECLVKVQTLMSELTCHIMNDYKKSVERRNPFAM